MDGFTEKKWFVYIGDHHEGPFSLDEVQEKVVSGRVTAESFVWAEGMADWQAMTQVKEFTPLLNPVQPNETPAQAPLELATSQPPPLERVEAVVAESLVPGEPSLQAMEPSIPISEASLEVTDEKTGDLDPAEIESTKAIALESVSKRVRSVPGYLKGALLGSLMLAGVGVAYQQGRLDSIFRSGSLQEPLNHFSEWSRPIVLSLVDRIPALGQWISPIPSLEDVSLDEYEVLKAAALEKPEKSSPRIALALSKADYVTPSLYLASYLPDGARFRIYVIGVSDTLLNRLSFETHVDVTLTRRLGKSIPIRLTDGKPIPKGEYLIFVTPGEGQSPDVQALLALASPVAQRLPEVDLPKDTKVLAFKTYFLGGQRDAAYTAMLREYHEKMRQKASDEINEVNQFLNILESQLNSSIGKFALLRNGKAALKQRQLWTSFHKEWTKPQDQLDQIFQKWTPESIHNDFFYDNLYLMTQQLGQAVQKVHGFHNDYFSGVKDVKTFDIQLGETLSSTQTAISALRAKIAQATALLPTPNGMPRREGI